MLLAGAIAAIATPLKEGKIDEHLRKILKAQGLLPESAEKRTRTLVNEKRAQVSKADGGYPASRIGKTIRHTTSVKRGLRWYAQWWLELREEWAQG
jgi:hypothetical protein